MSASMLSMGPVATPLPAFTAEDKAESTLGLLESIVEDAWLFIPFVIGFIVFSTPYGFAVEEVVWRWCHYVSKECCDLPSAFCARLAGLLRRRASARGAKHLDADSSPKSCCACLKGSSQGEPRDVEPRDVEYNLVHNELSNLRSEILRERGSLSVA